jgi:hypothetical protein
VHVGVGPPEPLRQDLAVEMALMVGAAAVFIAEGIPEAGLRAV